jgi:hypothetical protein
MSSNISNFTKTERAEKVGILGLGFYVRYNNAICHTVDVNVW